MNGECPFCGNNTMQIKNGEYEFEPPAIVGCGMLVIQNAKWWECSSCGEQMIPDDLSVKLDNALKLKQKKQKERKKTMKDSKIEDGNKTEIMTREELEGMSKSQLLRYADEHNIELPTGYRKDEIIDAIIEMTDRLDPEPEPEQQESVEQNHELHLQESKLQLADLAVKEAEKKAEHASAKKEYEQQRDYVIGLIARGNPDDEPNLFNLDVDPPCRRTVAAGNDGAEATEEH